MLDNIMYLVPTLLENAVYQMLVTFTLLVMNVRFGRLTKLVFKNMIELCSQIDY